VLRSVLLGASFGTPACADFKYTEKSAVTGGALVGMAKFAAVFSKKSAKQALQPTITKHYVKGNRCRFDNSDGTIHIIDLDARNLTAIDPQKKTFAVVTFDELKAAIEQQTQRLQGSSRSRLQSSQINPRSRHRR
jgi:hypothetical protein